MIRHYCTYQQQQQQQQQQQHEVTTQLHTAGRLSACPSIRLTPSLFACLVYFIEALSY